MAFRTPRQHKVYIYVLRDPQTNEVRYVGKTKRPKERRAAHWYAPTDATKRWVESLKEGGMRPSFDVIMLVGSWSGDHAEQAAIMAMSSRGHRLLNKMDAIHEVHHGTIPNQYFRWAVEADMVPK